MLTAGKLLFTATAPVSTSANGSGARSAAITIIGAGVVANTSTGTIIVNAVLTGGGSGAFSSTGTRSTTATIAGAGVVGGSRTGSLTTTATIVGAGIPPLTGTNTAQEFSITQGADTLFLEYFSNASLTTPNPAVKRVMFVVHGDSRNADNYADYMTEAATTHGIISKTLVVAPHFKTVSDGSAASDELFWSDGDPWKDGSTSNSGRPFTISSYAVLDLMVGAATTNFPGATIVITGHSAGGQYVQRYAAGEVSSDPVARFVPANPGSYLYLDTQRWVGGVLRELTTGEASACSGFDDYKYGLTARNNYMSLSTTTQIRNRYQNQPIIYLLGSDDNDTVDLDMGCEANWQGDRRIDRGEQYFTYIGGFYGVQPHIKSIVPGVGHSAHDMFNSAVGRAALFEPAGARSVTATITGTGVVAGGVISFVATNASTGQTGSSTTTAGTASITSTLPAGVATGDRIFAVVAHTGVAGGTPASWTVVFKDQIIGSGAVGAGTGLRYLSVYYRDYDGVWSPPTFTLASATQLSHALIMLAVRTSTGYATPTFSANAEDFGTTDTTYSATTVSSFTTHTNGLLIAASTNNDNVAMTATTISGGGSLGSSAGGSDRGASTGNDVRVVASAYPVTTGGSGTITISATLAAASQAGTVFVEQTTN